MKNLKLQKNQLAILVVAIIVVLVGLAVYWYMWQHKAPNSYGDCVKAGGQQLYSYPSKCLYNGKYFTNPAEQNPPVPQEVKPL